MVTCGLRVKLPPAHLSTTHGEKFTLSLFIAELQAGKLQIQNFIVFGLTRRGIEPESSVSVTDALCTLLLIGYLTNPIQPQFWLIGVLYSVMLLICYVIFFLKLINA